jgi:hypothetical protein
VEVEVISTLHSHRSVYSAPHEHCPNENRVGLDLEARMSDFGVD